MSAVRVHPFHKYGGAEMYIYNLANHLVKNGVDVKIITSTPPDFKDKKAIYDGIEYEFIEPYVSMDDKKCWLSYYHFNFNLARKLVKEEFDILHSFGITAHIYLKLRKSRNAKVVVEPFGIYGTHAKHGIIKKTLRKILIENPVEYCFRYADAIAVEGEIQASEISQRFGIPAEKFILIPDGINIDDINKWLKKQKYTRESLGLDSADIVLVNVNRLAKNKGVNYLINALKILNEKIDARLILIGSGPEESSIKAQIKSLGLEDKVLHFKNIPDEDKFQLISLADISVTPTLFEGLPIVILEAMACGKPVVASNVTEVPQVVKHGVNGFLVPPRNPQAIAEAVFEIYEKNIIEKMGFESRRIARNYDWNVIAKKTIKEYEMLIQ
jgi:glycosyltransferase involved in cell wall biosynthesis